MVEAPRRRSLIVLLLSSLGACGAVESVAKTFQPGREEEEQRAAALQSTAQGLGVLIAETVRDASDAIIVRADDLELQRRAILWKVRVVTAAREASRLRDSRVAMVDLCALVYQQAEFFASEAGRSVFTPHDEIATGASRELVEAAEGMARRIVSEEEFDRTAARLREFAREQPMQATFTRTPLRNSSVEDEDWLPSLGSLNPFAAGLSDTAAAIQEVNMTGDRFTDVVADFPETTRWQLELLLLRLAQSEQFVQISESVDRVSRAADALVVTADAMPERIRRETAQLIAEAEASQPAVQNTLREARTTAEALDATLHTFDEMLRQLQGDPAAGAPEPDPKARPFDVRDYDQTARSLTAMAAQLQDTLVELRTTLGDSALDARVEAVEAAAQRSIDAASSAALRVGLVLLGTLLAGLVVLRVWPRSRRTAPGSAA